MIDWLESLWEHLTSVSSRCSSSGWRSRRPRRARRARLAEHPARGVPGRRGQVRPDPQLLRRRQRAERHPAGLGGTVAMLGLFRANIPGATVAGLVGATVVENIFFAIVGVVVYLWLFLGAAGSFDVQFGWFCMTLAAHDRRRRRRADRLGVRILWRRFRAHVGERQGGRRDPRRRRASSWSQVVGVEALSYLARMGVNATFMYAFDIPVSVENVFLIVAASSVSSTIAVPPGRGRGADRAGLGRPAGRGAVERDQRLRHRAGNHHHGLERRLRPRPARARDRLEGDPRPHPRADAQVRELSTGAARQWDRVSADLRSRLPGMSRAAARPMSPNTATRPSPCRTTGCPWRRRTPGSCRRSRCRTTSRGWRRCATGRRSRPAAPRGSGLHDVDRRGQHHARGRGRSAAARARTPRRSTRPLDQAEQEPDPGER